MQGNLFLRTHNKILNLPPCRKFEVDIQTLKYLIKTESRIEYRLLYHMYYKFTIFLSFCQFNTAYHFKKFHFLGISTRAGNETSTWRCRNQITRTWSTEAFISTSRLKNVMSVYVLVLTHPHTSLHSPAMSTIIIFMLLIKDAECIRDKGPFAYNLTLYSQNLWLWLL